jgi:hypothetical protein
MSLNMSALAFRNVQILLISDIADEAFRGEIS